MSDYIERETLLHKIRWASAVEECVMSVRRMPAADVVHVKRGTWEKTKMDGFLRCSVCHDCYIDDNWLDAISTLIHVEKKKHDERKELLEQLKQSGARTDAEGFCDTAEQIEEDLEAMNARDDECEVAK